MKQSNKKGKRVLKDMVFTILLLFRFNIILFHQQEALTILRYNPKPSS